MVKACEHEMHAEVTLYVRVWIEIISMSYEMRVGPVTLYVRVWIEIHEY